MMMLFVEKCKKLICTTDTFYRIDISLIGQ